MSKCILHDESLDVYVIYHVNGLIYANVVNFFFDKTKVPFVDL